MNEPVTLQTIAEQIEHVFDRLDGLKAEMVSNRVSSRQG
jgi:hypothetical protein